MTEVDDQHQQPPEPMCNVPNHPILPPPPGTAILLFLLHYI